MKKWHKKPTSALQARVKELEDGSTTKVNFSKKGLLQLMRDTAIVRRTMEVTNRGVLAPARRGKGIIECTGRRALEGLAHQNHRNISHWWTLVHSVPYCP